MDFELAFPLRFWINLGRREDRRSETEARLAEVGISAERFSAVDARGMGEWGSCWSERSGNELVQDAQAPRRDIKFTRGYESAGRYALALTQRLALREAARRKASAVLLLEDDVVFHSNFRSLIGAVELPEDWGIFYLGCSHRQRPEWAGSRVVRSRYAVDTHAVAVRAPYYRRVMEMLDRHHKANPGVAAASDQFLALLHDEIPAYACYPNLAWQDVSDSDLTGIEYTNYTKDGKQRNWPNSVAGLLDELVRGGEDANRKPAARMTGRSGEGPEVRLGLMFLTRGDVNHPEVWQAYVADAPERVRVFSHPKHPQRLKGGFLEGSAIPGHYETEWGSISLVRATRAMLLAALEDDTLTHFALVSEACVPVVPLPQLLRRLELDPRPQFGFRTLKQAEPVHASRIGSAPGVPAGCWRFQSQWWLLDRVAAVFAAGQDFTPMFEKMMAPDEAYFATVLAMQGYPLEGEVLKRDSTWTHWEKNAGSPTEWPTLPQERLESLLHSGAIFARKFPQLSDVPRHMLHNSPAPNRCSSLE